MTKQIEEVAKEQIEAPQTEALDCPFKNCCLALGGCIPSYAEVCIHMAQQWHSR